MTGLANQHKSVALRLPGDRAQRIINRIPANKHEEM